MKLRTQILEDDLPAHEQLRALLAREAVEIVDKPALGSTPLAGANKQLPDLVILGLPSVRSKEWKLLQADPSAQKPALIVVAPSDEYAVQAFDLRALDFLLKPVDPDRLRRALQRTRDYLEVMRGHHVSPHRMRMLEDLEAVPQYLTRVKVKHGDRILFLKVSQIDWVEAADNYVVLHVGPQTYCLREKISALEASLDPEQFFRVSRSALVNVRQIAELRAMFKGEHVVVLNNGSQLSMTREVQELEELVKYA